MHLHLSRLLLPTLTLALFAPACALLTKSDPVVPRYFSPEPTETAPRAEAAAHASHLSVRLCRVGGGSYLKERMVYRDSTHEFGFYEDRRWTERPEVYLQRALEESLFEDGGVRRSLSSSAPTLTADLVAFEEVRGTSPHVRVRVSYALHDEQTVFFERTVTFERPLAEGPDGARPERVATALGAALEEAVHRMTTDVTVGLASIARAPDSDQDTPLPRIARRPRQ
jgi:cholesterol transport system auxiliary component